MDMANEIDKDAIHAVVVKTLKPSLSLELLKTRGFQRREEYSWGPAETPWRWAGRGWGGGEETLYLTPDSRHQNEFTLRWAAVGGHSNVSLSVDSKITRRRSVCNHFST